MTKKLIVTRHGNKIVDLTPEEEAFKKSEEKISKNKKTIKEQEKKEKQQAPYIEQRRNAYPPIGDQLDMLWHTIDKDEKLQGIYFDFYQTLKTVKVKYPKS